jgi:hypothetical protein
MLWNRLPLKQKRDGELDVWATVCVHLKEPLHVVGAPNDPPAIGYVRIFGIRMPGPQPKQFLENLISDGVVNWDETEFYEIDPNSLDRATRKQIVSPDEKGIWYKSGRIYFPERVDAG